MKKYTKNNKMRQIIKKQIKNMKCSKLKPTKRKISSKNEENV